VKSCKDDEIIAQGKRSAALGYGRQERGGVGWPFTQGGGLPPSLRYGEASGGLALGYLLAAPSGRRKGEPACQRRRRDEHSVSCRSFLARRASSQSLTQHALTPVTQGHPLPK
jgi:hypothetical protein